MVFSWTVFSGGLGLIRTPRNPPFFQRTPVNFSYWTPVGNLICPIIAAIVTLRIGSCSQRRALWATLNVPMTPNEFVDKWHNATLTERSASQEHFIDLCRLLGEPPPVGGDPSGATSEAVGCLQGRLHSQE